MGSGHLNEYIQLLLHLLQKILAEYSAHAANTVNSIRFIDMDQRRVIAMISADATSVRWLRYWQSFQIKAN